MEITKEEIERVQKTIVSTELCNNEYLGNSIIEIFGSIRPELSLANCRLSDMLVPPKSDPTNPTFP